MADREFSGGAVATTLTAGIGASDVNLSLASATGWPTGVGAKTFVVTVNRGQPDEEKVLCGSRSGTLLTVEAGGRGYDGTSAQAHVAGATVEHTIDGIWLTDTNEHVIEDVGAHAASAIANTPAGSVAATTVQGAIDELGGDVVALSTGKANASHTHATTDVTGLDEQVRDTIGTALVAGTNVTLTVNDPGDTITIAAASTAAGITDFNEAAQDAVGAMAANGVGVTLAYNDATPSLTAELADAVAGSGLTIASKIISVGAGTGITVAADAVAIDSALIDLDAWETWTPTWYGASAAFGNGTHSARYHRVGRTITLRLTMKLGTSSVMASDQLAIALPVAAYDPGSFDVNIGTAMFYDGSATTVYSGRAYIDHTNDTANDRFRLHTWVQAIDATSVIALAVSTSTPFAWAATQGQDWIVVEAAYEAAS